MRYMKWLVPILVIAGLLLVYGLSVVGASPPTNPPAPPQGGYVINWNILGGGGSVLHSHSFILMSTIGQPAIGNMSSASYRLQAGYWAGAWPWMNTLLPFLGK